MIWLAIILGIIFFYIYVTREHKLLTFRLAGVAFIYFVVLLGGYIAHESYNSHLKEKRLEKLRVVFYGSKLIPATKVKPGATAMSFTICNEDRVDLMKYGFSVSGFEQGRSTPHALTDNSYSDSTYFSGDIIVPSRECSNVEWTSNYKTYDRYTFSSLHGEWADSKEIEKRATNRWLIFVLLTTLGAGYLIWRTIFRKVGIGVPTQNESMPPNYTAESESTSSSEAKGGEAEFVFTSEPDRLLHEAALKGNKGLVEWALDNGASIDARESIGATPLHVAAVNNHLDVMRFLIEKGANVNAANADGGTPLHMAAFMGQLDAVRLLIEKGADVNIKDINGGTPLRDSSLGGHALVAKLLVDKGVNIQDLDIEGCAAIWRAAALGHTEMVRVLLEIGADINSRDSRGITPLLVALNNRRSDTATLLIERGADIRTCDMNGISPLHWAAGFGLMEPARLLIEKGADLNAMGNGFTPLHYATINALTEVVRLLVDRGAEVNVKDKEGRTPLERAEMNNKEGSHTDIIKMLRYAGGKRGSELVDLTS